MITQKAKSLAKGAFGQIYRVSRLTRKIHRGSLIILCYHRILPMEELEGKLHQPGMITDTDQFRQQIDYLLDNYVVLSLPQLIQRDEEHSLDQDRQYCILTFDDGWRDNFIHAREVLLEKGVPATIFLATDFIGTGRWFWPERLGFLFDNMIARGNWRSQTARLRELAMAFGLDHSLLIGCLETPTHQGRIRKYDKVVERFKKYPQETLERFLVGWQSEMGLEGPTGRAVLNWDEVRQMVGDGISFASHGHTHRILTNLTSDFVQSELELSTTVLSDQNLPFLPVFCYPNGSYNNEIIDIVRHAGYRYAVTTRFGVNRDCVRSPYELNRICIHSDIGPTVSHFAMHLSGVLCRRRSAIEA